MNKLTDGYKLSNGYSIPCVGFGTFLTPEDEVVESVKAALKAGYRHIDGAAVYGNEKGVGKGIKESGVAREEIFVTSKVWNAERGYEKTKAAFQKTLDDLGLEYLDLYLIHWPANRRQFGDAAADLNAQTWRAMEDLYLEGKIKSIGVSNFWPHHLEELMKTARIKPMVNQIEYHPGWMQHAVVSYCEVHNILVEAWSPLGRSNVLKNETVKAVAAAYGKSEAQICIRWALQHGILPLPKSVTPERIQQNAEVFDFEISAEDMQKIDNIYDCGMHYELPDEVDF